MILHCAYLPNLSWFRIFLGSQEPLVEIHEHYLKQTYRNRCVILSANGPLVLTVPVKKQGVKIRMHEVQTDETLPWKKQHCEAIRAAYGSAPYFAHYFPRFEAILHTPAQGLVTMNLELIRLCQQQKRIDREPDTTREYAATAEPDYRQLLHPKRPVVWQSPPYLQVFADRFPFIPDLSVLDLLFNKGPHSGEWLLQ
jgi:hypothetical protein